MSRTNTDFGGDSELTDFSQKSTAFSDDSFSPSHLDDSAFDQLQQEVDDAQSAIRSIQASLDEKTRAHKQEILTLQNNLELIKKRGELDLQEQISQQNEQYDLTRNRYEKQIQSMQKSLTNLKANAQKWQESRFSLEQTSNELRYTDAEFTFTSVKSQAIEKAQLAIYQKQQKVLLYQSQIEYLSSVVERLTSEVNDLQSHRRTIDHESNVQLEELHNMQLSREQNHLDLIDKLRKQMHERDTNSEKHLATIQERVSREQLQMDMDLENTDTQITQLQDIYRALTSNYSRQLSDIGRNIEQMKESVDNAKAITSNFAASAPSRSDGLRDTVIEMEEQLERILRQNEIASSQLYAASYGPQSQKTKFKTWF